MAAVVPVAIMAGQAIAGYIKNRNAAKAETAAQTERQTNVAGARGVSSALTSSGTALTSMGMPGVQGAQNYYQTLLGGNRAQMALATAGPRAAITDQYRGAEHNLERSGVRGAVGDLARATLNREQTGKIAGLTAGVQPEAAGAVANIGTNLLSQGGARLGEAGNIWGRILGDSSKNLWSAQQRHDVAGTQFGKSLFDVLQAGAAAYAGRSTGGYRGPGTLGYPGDATSPANRM